MNIDVEGMIRELGTFATELEAHMRVAVDHRATFRDRQEAAMSACELIARRRVLERLEDARQWLFANRELFAKARRVASWIDAFRRA